MMLPSVPPRPVHVAIALLFATVPAIAPAPADAQWIEPTARSQPPGWSFTPSLTFGGVLDDNVALARPGHERPTQRDYLTLLGPSGSLRFIGRRTTFESGYAGMFRAYRDLSELNTYEQHASASLGRQLSRRAGLSLRNGFTQAPSTDEVDVGGVPFRRVGIRLNHTNATLDLALDRRTNLGLGYSFLWVAVIDDEQIRPLFRRGHAHGGTVTLDRRLGTRLSIGSEYAVRYVSLTEVQRHLVLHHAGATGSYRLLQRTSISGAAGASWLVDPLEPGVHTGPFVRLGLSQSWRHTRLSVGYQRSFIPTFGLGGTSVTEEYRAEIHVPLVARRVYWRSEVTWRETEPLIATDLDLRSLWLRSMVGYAVQPWLRVEGTLAHTYQDSQVAGGQVSRNRIGFRVVTVQPMRLRR